MNNTSVVVVGSGFAGIAAATSLSDAGLDVTILEKNSSPGGRARRYKADGYTFDMGPSWYWMPDVFDSYFNKFGKSVSDYYDLIRLDPSYQVVFGKDDSLIVPAKMSELEGLFESIEPGSGARLRNFLNQAAYKYKVGINNLVYKPSLSVTEFFSFRLLIDMIRMEIFNSISSHVRKYFKNRKLLQLVEFPVLFLGATAEKTPALYSLMNYADMSLGTWYPKGGMHEIIKGMVKLAEEKGVKFVYNQEVKGVEVNDKKISALLTGDNNYMADFVIAASDYHHFDQHILPAAYSNYDEGYWNKRTMAPSSLIFYLGIDKQLNNLEHHNLFFDSDFKKHAHEIYESPQWPKDPLFYVSVTSKTDNTAAPEGCENVFILIPVAPGLKENENIREKYYDLVMERLEKHVGENIRDHVVYKRSYAHEDFKKDYHAFKGNAYGLANTLRQTAILKPSLKNKKLRNLYYTGQLTVPGPGVPPSLISGQVVAEQVLKQLKKMK
jgi:phytoene desaturase